MGGRGGAEVLPGGVDLVPHAESEAAERLELSAASGGVGLLQFSVGQK